MHILCEYGCNQEAKFKLKNGKNCCSEKHNSCIAIRKKNSDGLKNAHKRGVKFHIWTNEDRQKSNEQKIKNAKETAFTINNTLQDYHKKYLIEIKGYICEKCSINEWNGEKLTLEIDHINGNRFDNRIENLRYLCPNCHSQTNTWRGRNVNNGKRKFSAEYMIQLYKEHRNIHKTLLVAGMAAKGANYKTMKKLIQDAILNGEILSS